MKLATGKCFQKIKIQLIDRRRSFVSVVSENGGFVLNMANIASPLPYLVKREYGFIPEFKSHLFNKRLNAAKNLYRRDLVCHFGCVNAIEFSSNGELLVSGNICTLKMFLLLAFVIQLIINYLFHLFHQTDVLIICKQHYFVVRTYQFTDNSLE